VSVPEQVIFVSKAETAKAPSERTTAKGLKEHCTGTLEVPKAEVLTGQKGSTLCVYTGVEELTNAPLFGIVNEQGSEGAGLTGAVLEFLQETAGAPTAVRAQGTWALKAN
jgi:hypothetical protein